MRRPLIMSSIAAALGISALALAAPPDGKGGGKGKGGGGGEEPSAFVPEYAGVRLGGRNKPDEIVMADKSGDNIVTVLTSPQQIISLDLSVASKGLIAFGTLDGNIYLQQWYSSPFGVGEPELVFQNGDRVGSAEFSGDGTRLAFLIVDEDAPSGALMICDIDFAASPLQCSSFQRQSALDSWDLNNVRFDPYNPNGVILNARPPGSQDWGIYKYTLGGPAPDPAPFIDYPHGFDDVGKAHSTNEALIVYSRTGQPMFWSAADGQRRYPNFPGIGYDFKFNCSNDALLYAETGATGGVFLAVTEFDGPVEKLTSKGWNTKRQDWMPRENENCP